MMFKYPVSIMNRGTPTEKSVFIMLCTNIDGPANGTTLKEVFNEKKCPAMTKKMAQTRIRSNPQILLDVFSPWLRSANPCCVKVMRVVFIYWPKCL